MASGIPGNDEDDDGDDDNNGDNTRNTVTLLSDRSASTIIVTKVVRYTL